MMNIFSLPTKIPAMRPTIAAMGIEAPSWPKATCGTVSVADVLNTPKQDNGKGRASTYTTNEDNSFQTLSHDSDERQEEDGILSTSSLLLHGLLFGELLLGECPVRLAIFLVTAETEEGLAGTMSESFGKLDTPFNSRLVHLQKGETHDIDDDASYGTRPVISYAKRRLTQLRTDKTENTLP